MKLSVFMEGIDENVARVREYVNGGDGTGGECDCIGLIIGAIRLKGGSWTGTHGSNYAARYEMNSFSEIPSVDSLRYGDIVYKHYKPSDSGYALPSRYDDHEDQNDYYHVGVVTSVDPLEITHCTTVSGGIKRDSSLGAWSHFGRLSKIEYGADETEHSAYIWEYLVKKLGNEYGAAGLMGNLQAESGLYPDRVQGDVPYSSYSQEYTSQVDSGEISESEFVNNGPGGGGYGLAQWTFPARKQALYDLYQSGGYSSIGSIDLALDYLWIELTNTYTGVLDTLRTAESVREASDVVLHDFENPADQSATVEEKRASMGQAWYDQYAGTEPITPEKTKKGMSLLLMYAAIMNR